MLKKLVQRVPGVVSVRSSVLWRVDDLQRMSGQPAADGREVLMAAAIAKRILVGYDGSEARSAPSTGPPSSPGTEPRSPW